jgi:hypothetical protein
MTQGSDLELRQARQDAPDLARRKNKRNFVSQQATSNKSQGLRRFPIEPLRVIDDTEQWKLLSGFGQEA